MKIIAIIVILISLGAYFLKKKGPNNKKKTAELSPEEFVRCIEEKGYFKYTDSTRIEELKNKIIEEFHPESTVSTIEDDSVRYPLEFRLYTCDGESVYEDGGFTDLLKDLKPTFDKIGLRTEVTDHYEEWDNEKGLNHWLTLNGKKYIIFKNFKGHRMG
ncbi:MAG TPA: hypothetical protein VEC12_12595 [Bacteroidia bacterium]|nr:hypothetical protein [Bacteroidia bacterium]